MFCIGNWPGLDPTYHIVSSLEEQIVSTHNLEILKLECLKLHAYSFPVYINDLPSPPLPKMLTTQVCALN